MNSDPFERLGLPRRFSVDADELERRYLALSREAHPDFHGADEAARLNAEAQAAAINDAYSMLKDPFRRAEELMPVDAAAKDMPPAFLMEMLELREAIEAANAAERTKIEADLRSRERAAFERIDNLFEKADFFAIRKELNAAKYLRGLLRDLRGTV